MVDESIVAEKYLTVKGKTALFVAIEEYVDAKIEFQTKFTRSGYIETEYEKSKTRFEKAQEDLGNKIQALKIALI